MRSSIYALFALGCLLLLQKLSYGQVTANHNYIIKNVVKKSGITNTSQVSPLTVTDKGQMVGYFDGLGRPLQTVNTQGSPEKRDIINVVQYDNYGREITKYLPYVDVAGTAYGSLRTNGYTAQGTFYSPSTSMPGVARDTKPYDQTLMEFSPLNRPLEKGMTGQTWQPGGGHTLKAIASLNGTPDNVKKWTIAATPNAIPASSSYGAGELFKNITFDENGKQTVEYKDKEGKVILKKVQLLNTIDAAYSGWLSTYYVYDDFNNLRCVIPPKAVETLTQSWSFTNNQPLLDSLCFRYDYDARGRMITKKIPDAALVEMVYDVRDRLVFTRDGNLRKANKWLTTFYDGQNRPVMTALYTSTAAETRATLQTKMDAVVGSTQSISYQVPLQADLLVTNHDGRPEYEATSSITFDNGFDSGTGEMLAEITPVGNAGTVTVTATNPLPNIPASSLYNLTYTFYDDYTFTGAHAVKTDDLGIFPSLPNGEPANKGSIMTQGMVTGTKVRVLGTEQWLTTTNYYDNKNRTIQILSDNMNGGVDVISNLYDFSGKLLSSYVRQRDPHSTTTSETKLLTVMEYDHADRLTKITKKLNDGATKTIAQNSYNTLGQLYTKILGDNLETLKYDYNIRGWLQGMNRDYLKDAATNYFGYELAYDQPASVISGATYSAAQYNGNIAGTIWRSSGTALNANMILAMITSAVC